MSKYHGDQYWSHMRQQALHNWNDLSEDELEFFQAIRYSREVHARDRRARARRDRRADYHELEN